jgi:NADH pyrophosphatase NudC (nudix superfamily)
LINSLKIHYKNCDFCGRNGNKTEVNKNLKGKLCPSEEHPDKPHIILKIVIFLIMGRSADCFLEDTLRTTAV